MASFRNPVSRDQAWAKHYARQGLRAPITREIRSMPNAFRIANYLERRARHDAGAYLSRTTVKC